MCKGPNSKDDQIHSFRRPTTSCTLQAAGNEQPDEVYTSDEDEDKQE